mgnify:CR=1 FL=1
MIYTEMIDINGRKLRRTYSDIYKIARDGVEYDEAVDPIDTDRTYTETDTLKTETDTLKTETDMLKTETEE